MARMYGVYACFASASAAVLRANVTVSLPSGPVMIAAGITSAQEMCLTAGGSRGARASLEPCADAISAGDGRELFTFADGHLVNYANQLCLVRGVGDDEDRLVLDSCSGSAPTFELLGNGQLRIGPDICISQSGPAAGTRDAALHSAASSTSHFSAEHGPGMAVDGRATFWASSFNPAMPVELHLQLGGVHELRYTQLDWEYPARAFSVFTSIDGTRWDEVFTTDVNALHSVSVPLGTRQAGHVKVQMREPHPVHAQVRGRYLFGIRSVSLQTDRLHTVAEPCARAGSSADARDKFFVKSVGAVALAPLALHSAMRELDQSMKSLATVTTAVSSVMPELPSCSDGASLLHTDHDEAGRGVGSRNSFIAVSANDGHEFVEAAKLFDASRGIVLKLRSMVHRV